MAHTYKFSYSPHNFEHAEGHIYIDKPGACTITLTGAHLMEQKELDDLAEYIVRLLNKSNPMHKSQYNLLGG
jgi:hypothetical protein